jgi:hypothetical protein
VGALSDPPRSSLGGTPAAWQAQARVSHSPGRVPVDAGSGTPGRRLFPGSEEVRYPCQESNQPRVDGQEDESEQCRLSPRHSLGAMSFHGPPSPKKHPEQHEHRSPRRLPQTPDRRPWHTGRPPPPQVPQDHQFDQEACDRHDEERHEASSRRTEDDPDDVRSDQKRDRRDPPKGICVLVGEGQVARRGGRWFRSLCHPLKDARSCRRSSSDGVRRSPGQWSGTASRCRLL